MRISKYVFFAATGIFLGACTTPVVQKADKETERYANSVSAYVEKARQPLPAKEVGPVQVKNAVWTSGSVRRSEHGLPLPRQFETANGLILVDTSPKELFEIGTMLTETTGIPVTFSSDVFTVTSNGLTPDSESTSDNTVQPNNGMADLAAAFFAAPPTPNTDNTVSTGSATVTSSNVLTSLTGDRQAMKVRYEGPLSTFMTRVASHFSVGWEYTGQEIHVYRFVTRTYTVNALPSDFGVTSSLDAGNSSESDSGDKATTNQSAESTVSVKIWEELTDAVTGIVGEFGRVSTSVGTGTITVTAPVDTARRVQKYIDGQNTRMTKQVAISVQVLNVSLTDTDDVSIDIRGLFAGSEKYGFSFGNAVADTALAGGIPGFGFGILTGGLTGSNGVVQALSERGKVSVVNTASVTTLNGIPAPLQVSNTRNYLERIEVTTSDSGTSTSLTPGSVTTGFNLSILPRILDNNRAMLLQFGINISELVGEKDGFDEFTVDGLTIQQPNKNSRSFVQQTMVPNGSSLVLTGFEKLRNQSQRSGSGHPDFMLFGGGKQGAQERDVIVVILTPVLIDAQAPMISTIR